MIIIIEGLKGKNADAKVTYGGNISEGMTLNAYYPDGTTVVTALDSATLNLKNANAAGVTSTIKLKETDFDNAVRGVVLYVQGKILGIADELAIVMVESANLGYKKQGKPIIADLAATAGEKPLTVDLRKKVTTKRRRVAYVFQICADPAVDANYTNCMISTFASVTITTGLKPQTKYWFRVAIVEGMVMGKFSDPTSFTTA